MSRPSILICLVALATQVDVGSACRADDAGFRWEATPGRSIALLGRGGIVWRFNYAPDQPKPYFDPVGLVGGESLTWNQPSDHAWHHALWFSWKTINGVNYWEDDPRTKRPVGRTAWKEPSVSTDRSGTARIELKLTYAASDSEPVLNETRVVEVSAPADDGQYHFDWDATFRAGKNDVVLDRTPIPPDPKGTPWGGYAGLSLRFAEDLADRKAVTDRGEVEFDSSGIHRSRGSACDYHGSLKGRHAGIAVISHPRNPRSPTPWYAIRTTMSYLNPAFLAEEPYTIKAGDTLRLRYRIVVHAAGWNSERLQKEAARYSRDTDRAAASSRHATGGPNTSSSPAFGRPSR